MFLDLPFDVVGGILGDWLELRSFVRVDSAVCNHSVRQVLLNLFASKNCAQRETVALNADSCARWFNKRKVPITRVDVAATSQEVSRCLRLNSKTICSVYCSVDDAIDLAAMDCRSLTSFGCRDLLSKPNLNAILTYNMNLQELSLENVKDLHVSHFDNVHLSHLKQLSLFGTPCDDALLIAAINTTDVLQQVSIGKCVNITDEGLIAMAKHCPQLRSIGLDELPITDAGFEEFTILCPLIDCLNLTGNELITDLGLHTITKNLKDLRTLDLSNCNVTDLSLQHLALHSASTLEDLYLVGIEQVRVDVLVHFLRQCQQLRYLVLDCDIKPYCADIVPHMRHLESLLAFGILSDDCLCLIARHCKKLRLLGIPCSYKVDPDVVAAAHQPAVEAGLGNIRVMYRADEDTTKDDPTYTDKGLLALVDGLSKLERLYIPRVNADSNEDTLLHSMVQRMWQKLRPGLQFETSYDIFSIYVLDDDTL
eukprot:gene11234-13074_t